MGTAAQTVPELANDDFLVIAEDGQIVAGWPGSVASYSSGGRMLWRVPVKVQDAVIGAGGFALGSGMVYFGADSVSGAQVFRTFFKGLTLSGEELFSRNQFSSMVPPVVGPGETVYIIDKVSALRAYRTSGENAWTTVLDGYSSGAPALDSQGNLYVGTDGGNYNRTSVFAVSPDGRLRWTREATGTFSTPAISLDDRIHVASLEGTVVCFAPDGAELWRRNGLPRALPRDPLAVDSNGTIFFRNAEGITSLDRNGLTQWEHPTPGAAWPVGNVVLDRSSNLYFASGDEVLSLSSAGKSRWRVHVKRAGRVIVGADGTLYVVGEHRKVYAIRESERPGN